MVVIGVYSLAIPTMPSLVHMLDLKRTGEVAGRNLCPCLPQVAIDIVVWLRSLHCPYEMRYICTHIRIDLLTFQDFLRRYA
ncbi:hypothetical protein PsAD37_04228 [Pseudovibrio sp. Ad37]|nr:hypothetical protein PsAD37_04228 [Pseudovibrio sp. Ad37]KZL26319.1 hypothetical protein PsWM33_01474 [Pseudovibrio sp. WM33]